MTITKQFQAGRFFVGLTIDVDSPLWPCGFSAGYLEVVASIRTTPDQIIKIASTIERQLVADLGLKQTIEFADNEAIVACRIVATRTEAQLVAQFMRGMANKCLELQAAYGNKQ